jgi:hypothetical protein
MQFFIEIPQKTAGSKYGNRGITMKRPSPRIDISAIRAISMPYIGASDTNVTNIVRRFVHDRRIKSRGSNRNFANR